MKSLNAKKIAAVVTGAALLGVGLAFAGPVTFQNVPIISNSGQPVVQVVIGSSAKPADGVSAANIAAAIGNLAYTSVPVTASVNATQANSVLHVSVTSPVYSLSNQQVWLNESSAAAVAGSYGFSALIGSVLNAGVTLGTYANTKTLQGTGQYAFPSSTSLSISPVASPYTASGSAPTVGSVSANSNGGGVTFTSFTTSSNDNIMQVTHSQLSALASNQGAYGESETLWLTGFPVFDQSSGVNGFRLLQAGGAYQVSFGTPIQLHASATASTTMQTNLNAPITLLGQNWTIIGAYGTTGATSSTTVAGGKLELAQSLTPLQTVYVGKNVSSGSFVVMLQDLGQANSAGISPASLSVYYNGALTNTSSVFPGNTVQFNVTGHNIYVKVNQTFAGLYAYQKWAKMQVYSNVFNISNGHVWNQTSNPGWYTNLLWTNTTSTSTSNAVALQSIIIYNSTPTTLSTGQSLSFIQSPSAYKLTFVGETQGAANFDSVTATSSATSSVIYENKGTQTAGIGFSINNITEPAQELTVTSGIPNAFSYAGQTSDSVVYVMTPYELNELSNAMTANAASATTTPVSVALSASEGSFVSGTNPLSVTISGYQSSTSSNPTSITVQFTSSTGSSQPSQMFYNVTGIKLSRALPGTNVTVSAVGGAGSAMAILSSYTPSTSSSTAQSYQAIDYNALAGSNSLAIQLIGTITGISSSNPLLVTVTGNVVTTQASNTVRAASNGQYTETARFNSLTDNNVATLAANFFKITSISLSGVPSVDTGLQAKVVQTFANTLYGSIPLADGTNTITATGTGTSSITPFGPFVTYQQSGKPYLSVSKTAAGNVIYNQQNGQPTTSFVLAASSAPSAGSTALNQYYTYSMNEIAVPTNTAATDQISFGIYNSTAGMLASPLFQLNYSVSGTKNNVTYSPSSGASAFKVAAGFRTERGSKVASIQPNILSFSLAKATDMLSFAVGPSNTSVSGTSYTLKGPFGVGVATNLANVSIGKVTGNATLGAGAVYTISGVSNLKAIPSVSQATTYVPLKNLTSTPLVVLDSQANSGSNLILVGSGYVNTLSQQLEQAYNVSVTPTTQIMQAYGTNRVLIAGYYANQTTAAANAFIQQLYAQAASS